MVGESVGESVGDSVDDVGALVLHSLLHARGQKNATCLSLSGSSFLHRLLGFSAAHLSQSFFLLPLKPKVSLFTHSPRTLDGEVEGDSVGVELLHSSLQERGQKNRISSPVLESTFLHRLFGFSDTQLVQSLLSLPLKPNVSLFSHSSRALDGEVEGDSVGVEVLHSSLQKRGQKNRISSPVVESTFLHRLFGFLDTQLSQSFLVSPLKPNVSLFSHSSRVLDGEVEGDSVGDEVLHSSLQKRGQYNCTFFPVSGSSFLHRLFGFSDTHLAQSLLSLPLNRNELLFSQSS